jgi:hypothetical protein
MIASFLLCELIMGPELHEAGSLKNSRGLMQMSWFQRANRWGTQVGGDTSITNCREGHNTVTEMSQEWISHPYVAVSEIKEKRIIGKS